MIRKNIPLISSRKSLIIIAPTQINNKHIEVYVREEKIYKITNDNTLC